MRAKVLHLVVRLQEVQISEGPHVALRPQADVLAGADGKYGHIGRGLDLLQNLVEVDFAESVASSGDEDDVFAALDAAETVQCFVEGVEEIGLVKAGNLQGVRGVVITRLSWVKSVRIWVCMS